MGKKSPFFKQSKRRFKRHSTTRTEQTLEFTIWGAGLVVNELLADAEQMAMQAAAMSQKLSGIATVLRNYVETARALHTGYKPDGSRVTGDEARIALMAMRAQMYGKGAGDGEGEEESQENLYQVPGERPEEAQGESQNDGQPETSGGEAEGRIQEGETGSQPVAPGGDPAISATAGARRSREQLPGDPGDVGGGVREETRAENAGAVDGEV